MLKVNEDANPTVINLFDHFDDVEDEDTNLTFSVTGNTNSGLVGIDNTAGTLTLSFTPDAHGSADITVTVTDTGNQFEETSFTVTVTPGKRCTGD